MEDFICQVVGAPRPVSAERKFIVAGDISSEMTEKLGIKIESFHVEQSYLQKTRNLEVRTWNVGLGESNLFIDLFLGLQLYSPPWSEWDVHLHTLHG